MSLKRKTDAFAFLCVPWGNRGNRGNRVSQLGHVGQQQTSRSSHEEGGEAARRQKAPELAANLCAGLSHMRLYCLGLSRLVHPCREHQKTAVSSR